MNLLSVGLVGAAMSLGCSHQSSAAKPRPEPSAGAGLVQPAQSNVENRGVATAARPLLLHPSLQEVRLALEAQDDELAAVVLRSKMTDGGELGPDCRECQYLLGVIEERQGAIGRAVAAFESAAQSDWALRQDAVVHLVGLELQRKNCTRADQLLEQVAATTAGEAGFGMLFAQADLCQGRWPMAIARLRGLLASRRDGSRRGDLEVALAQALVGQTGLGEGERHAVEVEAWQLAEEALEKSTSSVQVFDRAKTLVEQLLTNRRREGSDDALLSERTNLLEVFVDTHRWGEAKRLSSELLPAVSNDAGSRREYCRILFASGRIASAMAERKAATEAFAWVGEHCEDADLIARALFLEAGLLAAAGKRSDAIAKYAELERRAPAHRLADDARLKQAFLYRAVGSESRFVGLLDSMPDDYPEGDMVLEGLFQLALKNMLQRNWSMALTVLERSERFSEARGIGKDAELDRLKYFLGRAAIENGLSEVGIARLRELVVRRPLTYYMLLAHSALARTAPQALEEAERTGLMTSGEEPGQAGGDSELDRQRSMRLGALLGVADLAAADDLLDAGDTDKIRESTVFAVAGMYANAGATKTALTLVKRRGRDWRVRWPTAGWFELWKQAFPRPYLEIVRQQAAKQGVAESLIYAIMREESEFDPKAVSHADAYGLMQLIVPTARTAGRELGIRVDIRSLQKPGVNIALGSRVLAKLGERFAGQVALIAAGYNAGPGRPARWLREYPETELDVWIELIEYPETRGYVKRVIESQAAYRWLYTAEGKAGATIEPLPHQLKSG